MVSHTVLTVLLLSQKLGGAVKAGPDDSLILVLFSHVLHESFGKLTLLQSLPVCFLPLYELLLQFLVLGSVAMLSV